MARFEPAPPPLLRLLTDVIADPARTAAGAVDLLEAMLRGREGTSDGLDVLRVSVAALYAGCGARRHGRRQVRHGRPGHLDRSARRLTALRFCHWAEALAALARMDHEEVYQHLVAISPPGTSASHVFLARQGRFTMSLTMYGVAAAGP